MLRRVGALAGDLVAQSGGQLLAVVGEELRIVRSARDGDIGHAVVEQVLRAQLRIHMHQHPFGGLPLAGVAGHGIAVIEMRMPGRIELHGAAIVHAKRHSAFGDALNRSRLAVRNFQVVRRRGELDAVAHGKATLFLAVDRNSLLPVRVVSPLRAVLQRHRNPVVRSVDAHHAGVLAFTDAGLLRCPTVAQHIIHLVPLGPCAGRSGEVLAWHQRFDPMRDLALKAARQRVADPMELLLAEQSATRYMLLNLFHATAQANAEGKHLLAESVLRIRDQANARKLADARKMLESFHAQEGQDGGQP